MKIFNLDSQEEKSTDEVRDDSERFLRGQNIKLIVMVIMTIGLLIGGVVFGTVAYQMVEHEYLFSNYGIDTRATITGCEMVASRSGSDPLISYRYSVDGQTYSNTWLAQFEYDNCTEVQIGNTVSVVYLRNDHGVSIQGEMSERSDFGYSMALFLGLGSVAFGFACLTFARNLISDIRMIRR